MKMQDMNLQDIKPQDIKEYDNIMKLAQMRQTFETE